MGVDFFTCEICEEIYSDYNRKECKSIDKNNDKCENYSCPYCHYCTYFCLATDKNTDRTETKEIILEEIRYLEKKLKRYIILYNQIDEENEPVKME